MSYDWYEEVLNVLGEVVEYTAVVNYAGNSYVEKSWDMILDSNPMLKGVIPTSAERALANFLDTSPVIEIAATDHGMEGAALFNG